MVRPDYPEVYSDFSDKEYVNDLIIYINKSKPRSDFSLYHRRHE